MLAKMYSEIFFFILRKRNEIYKNVIIFIAQLNIQYIM